MQKIFSKTGQTIKKLALSQHRRGGDRAVSWLSSQYILFKTLQTNVQNFLIGFKIPIDNQTEHNNDSPAG